MKDKHIINYLEMKKDKEIKKEKELSWFNSVRYIDFDVKMSWDEEE